jgi:integrase/recombinase XerD
LRPFQYPSLAHLADAAEYVIAGASEVEGLSEQTTRWFRDNIRHFLNYIRESGSERAFLSGDIDRQGGVLATWIASLRNRGVSRVTIRTYWNALNAVFARLERTYHMASPIGVFEPPKIGFSQPRHLNRPTAERLFIVVANYRWRSELQRTRNLLIIGLMLLAGLRRGEVVALKVGDVDLSRSIIRLRAAKGRHGGKDRTAYMPPQLLMLMRTYLLERDRAHRTHPELLTSTVGNQPVSTTTIKRLFAFLTSAIGLRVSPHMLRHTYATLLRMSGIPDRVAMDLMGHTSLAMLKRYSHVFDGEHASEVRKLHLDVDF